MRTIKKGLIVLVTALCVGTSFADVSTVEASSKPKARVTNVSAKISGKKDIKITFKKDKKAKSKGIKKYKIKITQYNYIEKNKKWKKGKVTYKIVSAYKGKKLKNTVSVTVKNKKVSNSVAYKVQVASTNSKGTEKTAYTYSVNVGCTHEWFTTTTSKKVADAEYKEVEKWYCSACHYTGSDEQVDAHMDAYRAKETESLPLIAKAYAEKYNCSEENFYYEYTTTVSNESQVVKFVLDWMNDNTEFKGCNRDYAVGGCIYSTHAIGETIKIKVKDAQYKTVMTTTCTKCGKAK